MKNQALQNIPRIPIQSHLTRRSIEVKSSARKFLTDSSSRLNQIWLQNQNQKVTTSVLTTKIKPLENPPSNPKFTTHISNPNDVQELYDYELPIYIFLRNHELESIPNPTYFENLTSITPKMRSTVIDWVIDVHLRLKMHTDTLYIIVNFIDRYLSFQDLNSSKFQRLASAAIFLAAKANETYAPSLHRLVALADNSFTELALSRMESSLFSILNFKLHPVVPSSFAYRFLNIVNANPKIMFLSHFFMESTLFSPELLGIRPSLISACSIALALTLEKGCGSWNRQYEEEIGYSIYDMEPIIKRIIKIVNSFQSTKLQALIRKFSGISTEQVSQIRIPSDFKLY